MHGYLGTIWARIFWGKWFTANLPPPLPPPTTLQKIAHTPMCTPLKRLCLSKIIEEHSDVNTEYG